MVIGFKLKRSLLAALIGGAALLTAASGAYADGSEDKGASGKVSIGTMSILAAPAVSAGGSAQGDPLTGILAAGMGSGFVVAGIVQGGEDSVQIVLNGVGNSAKITVTMSKSAVQSLAISTGTAVQLSAEASGTMLIASGKVIAFIPNKLGEALLSQSRIPSN